jgi:O-antigen/teichoic acid export membrane protein
LFVQNKIYTYSFFRAIPAIALILFALIGFQAEIIWPASFFVSVFFLIIYLNALFIRAITELSIKRIKKIKFLQKFYAAITATTFSFFSALFVIIINFYYGNEYVGLWSNTIRIFNSLLIFLLGASLPFVLNEIRVKNNTSEKVKTFLFLWLLICPLIILSFFITSNWGVNILSLFVDYDFEVPSIYLGYIVLVAISISFVGSSQALYQGINKSIILLVFIFISATLGFIFILNFNQSFIALVELFLISIFILAIMVLIHLLSLLLFKTNKLKESISRDF